MKLLLHQCCAPCSIYPINQILDKGVYLEGYFYNPNIHPYTEFRKRLEATVEYNDRVGINYTIDDNYGLREFIDMYSNSKSRCEGCYDMRFKNVAYFASQNNFTHISSTLLYSVYQNHDNIIRILTLAAKNYGIELYYEDFRKGWRVGIDISKEQNIYRQKYCGCIFSEEERYNKKKTVKTSSGV